MNDIEIPDKDIRMLPLAQIELNEGQLEGLPQNPRSIEDGKYAKLKDNIGKYPELLKWRSLLVYPLDNGKYIIVGGNMRYRAMQELGHSEAPVFVIPKSTPVERLKAYTILDNNGFGEWDWNLLAEWPEDLLDDWGVDLPEWEDQSLTSGETTTDTTSNKDEHRQLADRFIVPPFSILDTRKGYWQERKKIWKELIGDNGESRENTLAAGETNCMATINNGVSLLDPVMAEIVCRWFGIEGGNAFDCFAGDTVFGYVASTLGMRFTGIELREEQAALNNSRVCGMSARYICDDGRNVDKHIPPKTQDLLFSCPPYYDLEVYSDKPNDASNQPTYEAFWGILESTFANAIDCLKDNRFAVVVVGDIRDKEGFYYDFVGDIKRMFKAHGMPLYNECIIVEPIGTLPQRVNRYMRNRKVGKCHQNVLVFYKGDIKAIPTTYKEITYASEDLESFGLDTGD